MRNGVCGGLVLAALAIATPANAAYVVDVVQVGGNVVWTGSGALDTTALSIQTIGGRVSNASFIPRLGSLVLGTGVIDGAVGITGPSTYGTGDVAFTGSTNGVVVGVDPENRRLYLPRNYVSRTELGVSTSMYGNTTIARLGMTEGIYVWTWGTGATADSMTLRIGSAAIGAGAVPEPATWAMMIAGFGLIGGMMRRRRLAVAID